MHTLSDEELDELIERNLRAASHFFERVDDTNCTKTDNGNTKRIQSLLQS